MNEPKLLAFKTGRRAVGLAVFSGLTLECSIVRELSANGTLARQSTRAFTRWALDTFPCDSAVVESPPAGIDSRRSDLAGAVRNELGGRVRDLSVRAPQEILAEPDRPARQPRKELRALACLLWPTLLSDRVNPVALDAAALGLYRQALHLLEKSTEVTSNHQMSD